MDLPSISYLATRIGLALPGILGMVLTGASCGPTATDGSTSETTPEILTVTGPLPAEAMGLTLIHEHFFLDWSAAEEEDPSAWNSDSAYAVIFPYLIKLKEYGVQTVLECTPKYIGRNPTLLRNLSEASGMHILTNTGYYGARNDQHIPDHAYEETPDQLAARWIDEFENGIEGTGIRPGFIKIGLDYDSTLSAIDQKLIRAAARTHLATGLTIVAHTGPDPGALQEATILEEEGLDLGAWVWTHAQHGTPSTHTELARQGAWISLDGLGYVTPDGSDSTALFDYLDKLQNLKDNDLLNRTLIAHDAGWYTHGEPGGGDYTPHEAIFGLVIPALKRRGWTEEDIDQLLITNPKAAYAIRVRAKG